MHFRSIESDMVVEIVGQQLLEIVSTIAIINIKGEY